MHRASTNLLLSIIFTLMFAACGSSKGVQNFEATELEQTKEALSRSLLKTINTNDITHIEPYFSSAALARVLSPEQTEGLSDKEITKEFLNPLRKRLENNIANLRDDLISNGLNNGDLLFVEITEKPTDDPPLVPRAFSIKVKAGNLSGSIPIVYLEHEERIYIFEILLSVEILK